MVLLHRLMKESQFVMQHQLTIVLGDRHFVGKAILKHYEGPSYVIQALYPHFYLPLIRCFQETTRHFFVYFLHRKLRDIFVRAAKHFIIVAIKVEEIHFVFLDF